MFKTTIGHLRQALKAAITATGSQSATLVASQEGLTVKAASSLSSISVIVRNVAVENHGETCSASITGAAANAIFATVGNDTIATIKESSDGLTLMFGGARLKLKHREDESEIFSVDEKVSKSKQIISTTSSDLAKIFAAVVDFVPKKDVRYYLNGVYLGVNSELQILESVGTDGGALAKFTPAVGDQTKIHSTADMIVPEVAAHALATNAVFLGNSKVDAYQLTVNEDGACRLILMSEDVTWNISLIAGKYPNHSRLFSERDSTFKRTVMSSADLMSALARVLALSQDKVVHVEIKSGEMIIQDSAKEQTDRLPCESEFDVAASFACNGSMLSDVIAAAKADKVVIVRPLDPLSKFFVEPLFDNDGTRLQMDQWAAVAMPYRL